MKGDKGPECAVIRALSPFTCAAAIACLSVWTSPSKSYICKSLARSWRGRTPILAMVNGGVRSKGTLLLLFVEERKDLPPETWWVGGSVNKVGN